MFNLKDRAATLTAKFNKPATGFNSNRVGFLSNFKVLYLFLFAITMMVIPADALAQIDVGGSGESFDRFKDFVNDQLFPFIKIIGFLLIAYLVISSGFLIAARDPKWMTRLMYAFVVAIIFYGAPTLIAEIIDGWDIDYSIE